MSDYTHDNAERDRLRAALEEIASHARDKWPNQIVTFPQEYAEIGEKLTRYAIQVGWNQAAAIARRALSETAPGERDMSDLKRINAELGELLDQHNAGFFWDGVGEPHTWCLAGPKVGNGPAWETDDYTAPDIYEAKRAAVEYLRAYHDTTPDAPPPPVTNRHGVAIDFAAAVALMDNELRELLHAELAPCNDQTFFNHYCEAHRARYGEPWELDKPNPVW